MSKFATSCTPRAQFQLLNARSLYARVPISVTCTSGILCSIETPSGNPVPRVSESWSSLHYRLECRSRPEWRQLHHERSSSPSSQKSASSSTASTASFQCGPSILGGVQLSEPGTIIGASASGSAKYVGIVLQFCPLVPGRISGRSNRTSRPHDVVVVITAACPHPPLCRICSQQVLRLALSRKCTHLWALKNLEVDPVQAVVPPLRPHLLFPIAWPWFRPTPRSATNCGSSVPESCTTLAVSR